MKWILTKFINWVRVFTSSQRKFTMYYLPLLNRCSKFHIKSSIWIFIMLALAACTTTKPTPTVPTQRTDIAAYNPSTYGYAYSYFSKQADHGNSVAEDNLGRMYADGRGVNQDLSLSVAWYEKAAAQHNADAELNLGVANLYGRGIPSNATEACQLFAKASHDGSPYANSFYQDNCKTKQA